MFLATLIIDMRAESFKHSLLLVDVNVYVCMYDRLDAKYLRN